MLNGFRRHHGAHISASGGIANIACTAADKHNRLVAGQLQTTHQTEGHEVTDMQGVCRGVKADIESRTAVIDELTDFRFVCDLCDETACLQFLIDSHGYSSLYIIRDS